MTSKQVTIFYKKILRIKEINSNTNQNLDDDSSFPSTYCMKTKKLTSLNFLFVLSSYKLSALSAPEIDSKISQAKLFDDFFWVGNISTLFVKSDKKETFSGWAKSYYQTKTPKKQIRKITNYLKGRPIETIVWKPDGSRCKKTNLKDGDGQELHWHTNGRRRENSNYKNGLANGKFTLWYPNGRVEEEGTYLNGSLEGKVFHFDLNGKLIAEAIYKNGYPQEGTSVRFLGIRGKSRHTYEKGIEHGSWIWWDTHWKILAKGMMHQGKQKDAISYFTYHENGKTKSQVDLLGEKKHGIYKQWSSSGKIKLEGRFKNDLKDGQWTLFFPTGSKKIEFEKGKIKKRKP